MGLPTLRVPSWMLDVRGRGRHMGCPARAAEQSYSKEA